MKKHLKTSLALGIVLLTITAFVYYVAKHPAIIEHLKTMPRLTLVALLLLYGVWFIALALITRASLRIYKKHMPLQENFLFNAYSNLINFFGPGQSGPLFRGAYLKKRHNLGVKPYVFTLLIYYAFYGVISVLMLFVGTRPLWQTIAMVVVTGGCSFSIIKKFRAKNKDTLTERPLLNAQTLGLILLLTAAQLIVQAIIFGIELHNVGAHATIGQVLAYSGVANLALFVALTPGAIGIREAFLAFSQNLHHISGNSIVAANIVDRGVYLVFLGILFVLVITLHAKDKLHLKQLRLNTPVDS